MHPSPSAKEIRGGVIPVFFNPPLFHPFAKVRHSSASDHSQVPGYDNRRLQETFLTDSGRRWVDSTRFPLQFRTLRLTLLPEDLRLLSGRHLRAGREVLSVSGPRVYVSLHSSHLDVYGEAFPGREERRGPGLTGRSTGLSLVLETIL